MSVIMRIVQRFEAKNEKSFMGLEKQFAQLERDRPDYPKGRRMQPISGIEPCNTLVWECEFPDIASARNALGFFEGDAAHEALLDKQLPYFEQVRIEFYEKLEV